MATESPPQAQQGFAEPTLDTYVQPQDSVEGLISHSTQRRDSEEESG